VFNLVFELGLNIGGQVAGGKPGLDGLEGGIDGFWVDAPDASWG